MKIILMVLAIICVGGFGAYLDLKQNIKMPVLYYTLGQISVALAWFVDGKFP